MSLAAELPQAKPKEGRSGPLSVDELEDYITLLEGKIGDLHGLKQAIVTLGETTVVVDGWMKMDRALGLIDEFYGNLEVAIFKAEMRRRRGL